MTRPIRWLFSGAAAIVGVLALAAALRSPLDEAQALAASFDDPTARPVATGAAIVDGVTTGRITQEASPLPKAPADRAQPSVAPASDALPPLATSRGSRELRDKLTRDLQTGNHRGAVADIDALVTGDPRAADDRELRNLIVDLAMRIMVGAGPEAEQLFVVISEKMGTHGGDILYELVTTRGGSRAARRAEELLKEPAVFGRGTAAMRVAFELRTASCDAKAKLFERAKAEGDGRTLGQLVLLNNACGRRGGACCLHDDPALKEAIRAMRDRLGQ